MNRGKRRELVTSTLAGYSTTARRAGGTPPASRQDTTRHDTTPRVYPQKKPNPLRLHPAFPHLNHIKQDQCIGTKAEEGRSTWMYSHLTV